MADAQCILAVGLPTLAVLIGVLVNDYQIRRLRANLDRGFDGMNRRFESLDGGFGATNRRFDETNHHIDEFRESLVADFRRVEQAWTARLKHLEENR